MSSIPATKTVIDGIMVPDWNNASNVCQQTLRVEDSETATTLVFDTRQVLASTTTVGETTTYAYDPAGLLDRVTQPDGSFLDFTYDDAQRLVRIESAAGGRIDYTLDNMGKHVVMRFGDPADQLGHPERRLNLRPQRQPANADRGRQRTGLDLHRYVAVISRALEVAWILYAGLVALAGDLARAEVARQFGRGASRADAGLDSSACMIHTRMCISRRSACRWQSGAIAWPFAFPLRWSKRST